MKKKSFRKHRFLLAIILIYLFFGITIIYFQYRYITNYQYNTLGENALNLAALAVKTIHITNEDLKELEYITFDELREHPLNQELEKAFHLLEYQESIKYVYIIRNIKEDQEKYEVDEYDVDFYNVPIGTKLDYIWLLDVIVDFEQKNKVEEIGDYYKDKNRYTTINGEFKENLEKRETNYFLSESEWGIGITGVAPIYTTEGDYIGLLGVDMFSESFFEYRNSIFFTLVTLIMIPTLFTSCIYLYLYLVYRKKMNVLAYKDQLTNVYNRRYFDREGNKIFNDAIKQKTTVGIIIGDIDDFKLFNDKYGHQEGDFVLQLVTSVMQEFLSEGSGFVARYGGEEFIIVLENPENIEMFCQNICMSIAEKKVEHKNGDTSTVTISLGAYSNIPKKGEHLEQFVKIADDAMYHAKKLGKNTFVIGS
ncbi:MAG: GGDEF domain-containing protein [Lachnospiraceae bacterium]